MYMYIYVYTYVFIYIHIYMYIHTSIYICIHIYVYVYVYIHTCMHAYIYVYIYIYIYTHTHVHTYMQKCITHMGDMGNSQNKLLAELPSNWFVADDVYIISRISMQGGEEGGGWGGFLWEKRVLEGVIPWKEWRSWVCCWQYIRTLSHTHARTYI